MICIMASNVRFELHIIFYFQMNARSHVVAL